MTGVVGDDNLPHVRVTVRHPLTNAEEEVEMIVDTGFNGSLSLPPDPAARVALRSGSDIPSRLADGSEVTSPSYLCLVRWFGMWEPVVALGGGSRLPLVGAMLLRDRRLIVDYRARTVLIEPAGA